MLKAKAEVVAKGYADAKQQIDAYNKGNASSITILKII